MNFNPARFDLVSIRFAVLCARTGSLTEASKLANLALSTGSHRLSALEDAVGARLFRRGHRGLHVTAAGEIFMRHAVVILEQLQSLQNLSLHGGEAEAANQGAPVLSSFP